MCERILIETRLPARYKKFLEYCIDSGKIFIDELNETDFIAYRAKYAISRDEIEIIKKLMVYEQGEINLLSETMSDSLFDKVKEDSIQTLREIFGIIDLEPYENILITNLEFNNRIQNQLKKNNCFTLVRLLDYSVPELSALRNFGKDSIQNVLDVLKNFFEDARPIREKILPVIENELPSPLQTLREMFGITDLESYGNILIENLDFNKRVQNQLRKNSCTTLNELLNYSVPELSTFKNVGSDSVLNILTVLEKFFSHPPTFQKNTSDENIEQNLLDEENLKNFAEKMVSSAFKKEKQREIICKRADGKTLEEIGRSLQITRERVRQIENKSIKSFQQGNIFKLKKFFESLCELIGKKSVITFDDVKNFLAEDSAKILWFFISKITSNREIFYFDSTTNAVVFQTTNQNQIDYDKLIGNLPVVLKEDELKEIVEKIVEEWNCSKELLELKIFQTYKHKGKFFHRGRLTLTFQCSYVLRERFQSGYKISDETHYSRFVRYLRELFGYVGEISQRALDAKIGSYIGVLCDRGKYIHPDFLHIPQKIILMINDYIEQSDRTVLPYKEIFTALKEHFVGTQITNHYILQGVIKYSGTSYNLFRDYLTKNSDVNLAAEFNNFVEKNYEVSTQDIKAEFISFQDYNIALLLQQCPEVIYIGNGKYLHSTHLNLQENDFEELEKFLHKNCSDLPVSMRYLFNIFWERFPDFLNRNRIEDSDKLFGILKYMFSEKFNFSRPYISTINMTDITNKKVLLQHLADKDEIEIEDILAICEERGMHYIAKTILIESLSPEFIRVDEFCLCRPESIGVTDEVIATVIENVQLVMERNGGWQSAKTFPDFEWLPHLTVSWNSFLLDSVVKLSENNFKILRSHSSSGEFSTTVFVSENFEEDDFDSFCLKVLIEEHEREAFSTKGEILDWLQEQGLTNKKFPKAIEGHLRIDANNKVVIS